MTAEFQKICSSGQWVYFVCHRKWRRSCGVLWSFLHGDCNLCSFWISEHCFYTRAVTCYFSLLKRFWIETCMTVVGLYFT
jgi:hypothetical protein